MPKRVDWKDALQKLADLPIFKAHFAWGPLNAFVLLAGIVVSVLLGWLNEMAADEGVTEVRRTFVIEPPRSLFPDLERAPVEFDHELHTKAVGENACTTCHRDAGDGEL